jgi:SAM-dependent methyltransferase
VNGTVNSDSSVYYQSGYWNDLRLVQQYLNRRATGDPEQSWSAHLGAYHGGKFAKALVLNCGNGWVERGLVQSGLVAEAVGVDYSDDLLAGAREEADKLDLPLRYAQLDTNSAQWPEDGFDLVINHAAGHHIAYLDRVLRSIAELLPPDGVLVSWDYVGAHRNQYPAEQWEAAWRLNASLPDGFRHPEMVYPHLPTMLHTDPTEAIHAELILPTMRRYFDLEHLRTLGGGLAYPVLTFNRGVFDRPPEEAEPIVAQVLAADEAWTDGGPETRTLFAYVIARPRKAALDDAEQLAAWTAEEEERERRAAADGNRYYPDTLLGAVYDSLDRARREAAQYGLRLSSLESRPEPEPAAPLPPVGRGRAVLGRLRANPRLRSVAKRIPGARPAVFWLRRRRAAN